MLILNHLKTLQHYFHVFTVHFQVSHLYFPTNALDSVKLIRLKSTFINILKDY